MKKLNKYLLAIISLAFVFTACDEEEKLIDQLEDANPIPGPVTGDPGALNLSNYVAIGNSLTAGFQDGAMYTDGQEQSFPALLAKQFQTEGVGGGEFGQPDINSVNGYSSPGADGVPGTSDDLGRFELSLSLLAPVPTQGELFGPFTGDKSSIRNFGVPGMRAGDIADPSYGVTSPLYGRFATNPGVSTVLGDALAANPTFFTYWLGNNDILGYAAGGGANDAAITPIGDVQAALATGLGAMVQTGAQGVVMTVPLIVTIPYFRAVPYNAIPLTDQALVNQLNGAFAGFNAILDALVAQNIITSDDAAARKVTYSLGGNPILMEDEYLTDLGPFFDLLLSINAITDAQRAAIEPYRQSRPATADDLPVLASATVLGTPVGGNPQLRVGITVPAPDALILSATEVQITVAGRASINATIAGVVEAINAQAGAPVLTLVDTQPAIADLAGLDAQTAAGLVDPSLIPGSPFPAIPALRTMANNAAARADGVLGIEEGGFNLAPDFSPNGVYSTDGVHPNPRGAALFANEIINTLNATKGSNIPLVDVLVLRGVISRN